MSRVIAVIPARMGSSRFPGKPLASLLGKPMLQHVFERTAACTGLDRVVVATCDTEIAEASRTFGAEVVMTSAAHERASDRVAEASASDPADIVVMVQGDEPMILPGMVEAAIAPLGNDRSVQCVNLAAPIATDGEWLDANTVKVVASRGGEALYFSRAPIPHMGGGFRAGQCLKQVCVIAFRREALNAFASLPQGPLEVAESVDMLRFVENGIPVHIACVQAVTHAVDTQEDLAAVAAMMTASSRGPSGAAFT